MQSIVPPESGSRPATKPIETPALLEAVQDGKILSAAEAAHLLGVKGEADCRRLRETADDLRQRQCQDTVTYTTGLSLFLTNFCELQPVIYPYPRKPGDSHTFTRTIDDIDAAVEEAVARQFRRIYISGGGYWSFLQCPGLETPTTLKTYARVVSHIRERAPGVHLVGFSPDEVEFLAVIADRNERYILELLRDHGLDAMGGYGMEILDDGVRRKISPKKATVKRWFEIATVAHQLDIPIEARLEAGHFETLTQRANHLMQLRQFLQQHPGAFNRLGLSMWSRPTPALANQPGALASDRMHRQKLMAVARLVLGDVLPTQQVIWAPASNSTDTLEQAQEGLNWGAGNLGGTDALAYTAFLSGSREPVSFSPTDLEKLIDDVGKKPGLI